MRSKTRSPFQSRETREICDHMTESEKKEVVKRGGLYGVWVAISLAIPISLAFTFPSSLTIGIAVLLAIIHLIGIPIWQKKQREFLCSTEWAKAQGYSADQLKMFGRKNDNDRLERVRGKNRAAPLILNVGRKN